MKNYIFRIIFFLSLFSGYQAKAQLDTLFWFVMPELSPQHGGSEPTYLRISSAQDTIYNDSVIVDMPATGLVLYADTIAKETTYSLNLTTLIQDNYSVPFRLTALGGDDDSSSNILESGQPGTEGIKSNRGIRIRSKGGNAADKMNKITVYCDRAHNNNTDIWSLKGKNGLGTEFTVPMQNIWPNVSTSAAAYDFQMDPKTLSGFDIVATAVGITKVTITPTATLQKAGESLTFYTANVPFDVYLQQGETFACVASDYTEGKHLGGSKVVSDNPIAITWRDDSVYPIGQGYDATGDQIIPDRLAGYEFIVMRGELAFDPNVANQKKCREYAFVMAIEDSTVISSNCVFGMFTSTPDVNNTFPTSTTDTLNAGKIGRFLMNARNHNNGAAGTDPTKENYDALYINATKPVIVFHITGFGDEIGGGVVPSIDMCTGSKDVSVVRALNTSAGNNFFFINLMTRTAYVDSIDIRYAPAGPWVHIDSSNFAKMPGTDWWYLEKPFNDFSSVAIKDNATRIKSSGRFHLSTIEGNTSGCKYGYFSDFSADTAGGFVGDANSNAETYCWGVPIRLSATGGKSYLWWHNGDPSFNHSFTTDSISDIVYATLEPNGYVQSNYLVKVEKDCYDNLTSSPIDTFQVDVKIYEKQVLGLDTIPLSPSCCSPTDYEFTNIPQSYTSYEWSIPNENDTINFVGNTYPNVVTFTNKSNAVKYYDVEMTALQNGGICKSSTIRSLKVKPEIFAKANKGISSGCNQNVTDTFTVTGSKGPYTDIVWVWNDGKGSENFPAADSMNTFSHTFDNYTNFDTTYFVKLVLIDSINDCSDTANTIAINVPGVARARYSVSNTKGCSPLNVTLENHSNGIITYKWWINDTHDFTGAPTRTDNFASIPLTFSNNASTLPKEYYVYLEITKTNLVGPPCIDTYGPDSITVYPEWTTNITTLDPKAGCNPISVDFNSSLNLAIPNLNYNWNFGDGSTYGDSDPALKKFQHTLPNDQPYYINLTTTSEYNCTSVAPQDTVISYAFVDANFTVLPDTFGCSPVTIQVTNNTHPNSINNLVWSIPDNLNATPSPVNNTPFEVKFENLGTGSIPKTITLSNSNAHGCPKVFAKQITVHPEVHTLFIKSTSTDTICSNTLVKFTNTSYYTNVADLVTVGASYLWDFGDGTTSDSVNPSKQFTNVDPGVKKYLVKLNLIVNGCTRIYTDSVFVYQKVKAQFNTDSTNLCAPVTIVLKNTSTGGTSYFWQFSDGTPSISVTNKDSINYSVDNTNTNSVKVSKVYLTASTATCSHKDSLSLNVYPRIVPLIVPDVFSGCGPLDVSLSNQTTGGNAINPLSYSWSFGDGGTYNTPSSSPIPHTFANKTSGDVLYNVSLVATNKLECYASHSRTITVFPEIEPKFTYSKPTYECTPMEVSIKNNSLNGNQFNWDFGDGKDTTLSGDFPHTFYHTNADPNLPDTYKILLEVVDVNHIQCKDTISHTITINPQVVSSFDVTNDSIGCSPLNAEFTNNSTGYSLTYVWDYKDQNTSGNSNTIHTHLFDNLTDTNAVYEVKLTAYDANGCPDVDNQLVTAYPKVRANFTLKKDINNTCTPYPIDFSYPETALNGNKFTWDFGEGNDTIDLDKKTFTHTFDNLTENAINPYTIQLTSLDTVTGCIHDTIRTIEVYPRLVPQFIAKKDGDEKYEGCNALILNFENQSTGLADYLWDFGDRQTSPEVSPEHIFSHKENKSKDFSVLLKATQTATGCTKDISKVVTVYSYLNPKFGLRQDTKGSSKAGEPILGGCTPFDVLITDSSTTNYYWHWDFGSVDYDEENDLTAPAPRHLTYYNDDEDGTMQNKPFTITLIVENTEGCTKTTSQSLEVYPRAVPDFSVVQKGCHPLGVEFKNNTIADDSSTYYWNLGDGATAIEDTLSHTYFNNSYFDNKDFEVKLTATTKNLCSDYITKKITVYPKPSAAISPVIDRGCSPLTAELINKSKVSSPATFLWDFDNGETKNLTQITTEEPEYINNGDKAEVKNVQLIVITNNGCSDTVVQLVNVYPKANASFIPTKTKGCSPLEVTFRNLSNTTSTVYKWNFGNGATSQQKEPVYRYINDTDNDQVYTVTLNVESPFGCADTIQRDIAVYLSPNAEFVVVEPIKLYPDTVLTFQNQVKPGPWTFDWDYGDGQFSNETKKVHDHGYTGWGPRDEDFSYIVWLTAYSDFCRDSISQVVTINPPKPEINILQRNQTGCEPLIVAFDVGYRYGYKDSVKWNFGDGIPGSGIQTEHEYGNAGLYISTVTIKGDGGIAIDTTKIYVWPLPQPSFEFRPDFVMLPDQPVQFFNTTYLVDESRYLWDFGDGTTDTIVQPWHQYTEAGTYTIKLVATTLHGCMDSVMSRAPVTVSGEGSIKFPNAFLPTSTSPANGSYFLDAPQNDVFHPIHKGVKKYELWIFNRWGEQVFYSDNISVGWNGRYGNNGAELGQDVYFWKTKGNFNNDVPFKEAGDVTLIRR